MTTGTEPPTSVDPEATPDAAEEAAPSPAVPPERRRFRPAVWQIVVAGVLVVGLVVAATWLNIVRLQNASTDEDRAAAVATARQAVVTMTTTDPGSAAKSFQQLTELATGSFAQQLQSQSDAFVQAVKGAAVISQGSITEAAWSSGDEHQAKVLVSADSMVRNDQVPTGEPRQYRMSLTLAKQGDRWLVSNLDFVA